MFGSNWNWNNILSKAAAIHGSLVNANGEIIKPRYVPQPAPGQKRAHKRRMAKRTRNDAELKARIADDVRRFPATRQVRRRKAIEAAKARRSEIKARAAQSIKDALAQRRPSLAIPGGPAAMRLPKTPGQARAAA